MINNSKRLILGTLVSVFLFFVILVPNSYSKKSVYRDARCDCVNGLKGSCIAGIALRKIDSKSQGASLNYYSLRIQVPATNTCARVIYYVGMDPNTRIVTDGIYTENFSYLQDLNHTDVRVDSCNVCGDLYRDNPSEKSEQEKRDIDKWLESGEKRAREDNEYFESLSRQSSDQGNLEDDLALLDQLAEDEHQRILGVEERIRQRNLWYQKETKKLNEQIRQIELQRQRAAEEGDDGGFFDSLGDVLFAVALGTAMVADIEGGTTQHTQFLVDSIILEANGYAQPPYPGTGQNSLTSGSGNCAYERQKLPDLQRLINKANNLQGVCDKSRAAVKVMQLTYEVNKRCKRPQAQIQSALDTLNGARASAKASCEKGAY